MVGFLKVLLGKGDARPYKGEENPKNNEWTIFVEHDFIDGELSRAKIDLAEEFSNTFGKDEA